MRTFFDFGADSGPTDLEYIGAREIGEFDTGVFARCQYFEGPFPEGLKLWLSRGKPTDVLGNGLSWPMLSDHLIQLIKPYCAGEHSSRTCANVRCRFQETCGSIQGP